MKKRGLAGSITIGLSAAVLTASLFVPNAYAAAASAKDSRTSNTYVRNGEFIPVKLRKAAEKADKKARGKNGKYVYVIGETNADKKENSADPKNPADEREEVRSHQIMTNKKGKKQYDQVYVIGQGKDKSQVKVKKGKGKQQLPKRKKGQKYDQVYVIG